jgi:hypothetical protein
MTLANWMDANLETQGYCLSKEERRDLWLGLRFSTGVCLALAAPAVILGSWPALLGLAAIAAVAGFSSHHPFDHVWNGAVRHLFDAPPIPPSPPRRRHSFKVATAMMATIAGLFALGADTAGLVLGLFALGACTAVTTMNLCLPSLALSLLERRRGEPVAT